MFVIRLYHPKWDIVMPGHEVPNFFTGWTTQHSISIKDIVDEEVESILRTRHTKRLLEENK